MTESTTIEAPPARLGAASIAVEDDPIPIVRLLARTLRDAPARIPDATAGLAGTVIVRSHDTPQVATLVFAPGIVEVAAGALAESDATVVVDLNARFAPTEEPTGNTELSAAVLRALCPPVPGWREAAARFWEVTRDIPGIPDVLVVDAEGSDGTEHGRFGDGPTSYLVAGPAGILAGVFSGADDFLASLAAGVQVQGTLSQLSVMTAASWRVRFDV
ncbi:hypothetical protein G5C66_18850 [Nocardioides sp. KC13]|uniref:Uncharacterized protein n=1 Tax=Nocardioides turkmenicus TaxID=2711220 RepID=A0A6M1R3Y1_9ACTN|nr:hypothetical protein [Nocardioides sp. KC13]NGN94786.1 hypothetical protein [Nocardioides sp. KC13]